MAHKTKHRPASTKRANDSFKSRYGMTRGEWAKFKKEHPHKAHEKRMRVQARFYS